MRRLEGLCAGKESEWKGVIVRERWGVGAAYWRHVGLVRVEGAESPGAREIRLGIQF